MKMRILDVWTLVFKSIVYGFTIGLAGCYNGYNATRGQWASGARQYGCRRLHVPIVVEEMIIVQTPKTFLENGRYYRKI